MLETNQLINANFSRAAAQYLAHAKIQKKLAHLVCEQVKRHYQQGLILDIGSGPGTFMHINDAFDTPVVNLDLSIAMLQAGNNKLNICCDAHSLPIASCSFAMAVSNLMLQWSPHKKLILNEVYRGLIPGGVFIFTTLVPPSLFELQHAWSGVDDYKHTIDMLGVEEYYAMLSNRPFLLCEFKTFTEVVYFKNCRELLAHFKNTGTTLPKLDQSIGIGGKNKLLKLEKAYEDKRTHLGLPLTYKYLLVTAKKLECN